MHPYLCNAVRNFVKDNHANGITSSLPEGSIEKSQQQQIPPNKEFYIAFENVSQTCKYIILLVVYEIEKIKYYIKIYLYLKTKRIING